MRIETTFQDVDQIDYEEPSDLERYCIRLREVTARERASRRLAVSFSAERQALLAWLHVGTQADGNDGE
jgi:hypothetical protein